jgi:hypothetical protein
MTNLQTYTFWQLASQYKIEVPIVQRDYAQGRADLKSKEKLVKNFVPAIQFVLVAFERKELIQAAFLLPPFFSYLSSHFK